LGEAAPERFVICENGVRFELGFNEGYSTGLFLDQRDNRRRFLTGHIAADFDFGPWTPDFGLLNCSPTPAASRLRGAGGRQNDKPRSLEKYLEWGRRNFA